MLEELFSQLAERGYQGRIVAIQHLGDLQGEIEGHYRVRRGGRLVRPLHRWSCVRRGHQSSVISRRAGETRATATAACVSREVVAETLIYLIA